MTETEIFGLDFPAERYDLLAFTHIKPKWLEHETHLMTSKWWDYRHLNPTAATYLYAHHYARRYLQVYKTQIDSVNFRHVRPLKFGDLFICPPMQISTMWRGRQHADAMGIPYELYSQWAIEARMSYWTRPHLPPPQMLYSELVTDKIQLRWEAYLKGFLMVGRHESYLAKNYIGLPAQDQHHEWVFEQAEKRANVTIVLEDLVRSGLLPIEKVKARYGKEVLSHLLEAA